MECHAVPQVNRLTMANHNLPDQALGDGLGSKAGGREDASERGGTRLLASSVS